MNTFAVPQLPNRAEAYRLMRPYAQREKGTSDEQYTAAVRAYADAVTAIDVYLCQECDQYRYWFECGDLMEMNACIRAMEKAILSRWYLTLNAQYGVWNIVKGQVVTNCNALLTFGVPEVVKPFEPVKAKVIEIKPVVVNVPIAATPSPTLALTVDYVRESIARAGERVAV